MILHLTSLLHFIWGSLPWSQRSPVAHDVPVTDLLTSGVERGPLTERHTLHLYLNKHLILNAIWFFFTPLLYNKGKTKLKAAHWPEKGLCLPGFGQWRGFREEKQPSIRKGGGGRGKELRRRFNGALSRQMTGLAAVVAVHLSGLAALHRHVTNLTTPVNQHAFQFSDKFKPFIQHSVRQ